MLGRLGCIRRLCVGLNTVYPCARRTYADEVEPASYRFFLPDETGLDASILEIANEPGQAEVLCLSPGGFSKEDSLHATTYEHV